MIIMIIASVLFARVIDWLPGDIVNKLTKHNTKKKNWSLLISPNKLRVYPEFIGNMTGLYAINAPKLVYKNILTYIM